MGKIFKFDFDNTKIPKSKTKYEKIGQKFKTPSDDDSLLKFYKSLLKQKPSSVMAMKWCLEHGVLKEKKAEKIHLLLSINNLKIK
jgi:hypothetical protein